MKVSKIITCAFLSLFITACNEKEGGDFNVSAPLSSINIVTSLEDGTSMSSKVTYTYRLLSQGGVYTGSINSTDFLLGRGNCSLIVTDEHFVPTQSTYWFKNVSGSIVGSESSDIDNGNFYITVAFINPFRYGVYTIYNYPEMITLFQYNVGNRYRVNSFPEYTCFNGAFNVNVNAAAGGTVMPSYSSESAFFQLFIDADNNIATIILNDAKFSDMSGNSNNIMLRLSGLRVTYENGKIIVSGTDIIPENFEISGFVASKEYFFNSIEFQTTNQELTKGEISFVMTDSSGNVYEGKYNNATYLMFNAFE